MKVYVIKYSNGTYKGMKSRLPTGWRVRSEGAYETVSSIDEAQHYVSSGMAKSAIKNFVKTIKRNNARNIEFIAKADESKRQNHHDYQYRNAVEMDNGYKSLFSKYGDAVVEEIETEKEESNLRSVDAKRLKFKMGYDGKSIRGKFSIGTATTSRHYCKICGVVTKNIPAVSSNYIYGFHICAKCGIALGEECKRAWEAIPETERLNLDKEFFVHNLD